MRFKSRKQEDRPTRPDLVVFDLDNTLYDYESAHQSAIGPILEKAEDLLNIPSEQFLEIYGESRDIVKSRLRDSASSHSRLLYFQVMIERMGMGSQPLIALDLEQTYWSVFLKHIRLFDGVTDFLEQLRIASVPCAVVTNLTSQIQFRKICYLGLDDYFDIVVTSEESGREKPAAMIFELMRSKLHFDPASIWMIGDSIEEDMVGAKLHLNATTMLKINSASDTPNAVNEFVDLIFWDFGSINKLLHTVTRKDRKCKMSDPAELAPNVGPG